MASDLSNKSNYWNRTEILKREFDDLKKDINNTKSFTIPNYKKDFI